MIWLQDSNIVITWNIGKYIVMKRIILSRMLR